MRIGYAKVGRSMSFRPDKWGFQGDAEAPNLLRRLALRHPDIEWVVVGRNDIGQDEEALGLPPNVTNAWRDKSRTGNGRGLEQRMAYVVGSMDGIVMHAGQHGTSHISLPTSHTTWAEAMANPQEITTPQDWAISYGRYLTEGMNILGDRTNGTAPVVWLITDPRNFMKLRDVKWPTGCDRILAQYQYDRDQRHDRFRDPRHPMTLPGYDDGWITTDRDGEIWVARHQYQYGGLELMILPDDWETWGAPGFDQRIPVAVATTSFAKSLTSSEPTRAEIVRDWILKSFPDAPVAGKWDAGSLALVPPGTVVENEPHEFQSLLESSRVTLAMPALGSSWTTAKPVQCWAANTVCFMVDPLDDQGWLLPATKQGPGTMQIADGLWSVRSDWKTQDLQLAQWLRVDNPGTFTQRAAMITGDPHLWQQLVNAQRDLLHRRWNEYRVERMIEEQLGIG